MTTIGKAKRILVTSALPYANGPIHLGHLAGAYLPADIFVRYCRLKKRDVLYVCGSDENGVPIMLRAREEGTDPQGIVDRYHAMIEKSFREFGMSFDHYGRTSSPVHHETSQAFFKVLSEKGQFVLKKEKHLYDPEANLFLADCLIFGICPFCEYERAYGDQCEKCGRTLNPEELKHPRSTLTNAKPVERETTHWYLPLDRMQPGLEEWLSKRSCWKPNVMGQVQSWLQDGLRPRAVTRDLPWGIQVPEEAAAGVGVDVSGKVIYVWFDAPIGYISATKEWAQKQGDPDLWKSYWQDEETCLIHFIGKDNMVFHCLIFPAMLMAHGEFVLPENVPANEFLNLEGQKLSTSRNYAVWLHEYLEKFEPDSLRYALGANLPETRDADFSWRDFQARHNNELADILGNFVNRTFTFIWKYFDESLPTPGEMDALDRELVARILAHRDRMGEAIDRLQFKEAIREFMDMARFANKYFNDQEPWKTRKSDPEKCATTLNLSAQTAQALAIMMNPVLPFTSNRVWKMLMMPGSVEQADWEDVGSLPLKPGHRFEKPAILFKKIEDEDIEKEIEKLRVASRALDQIGEEHSEDIRSETAENLKGLLK